MTNSTPRVLNRKHKQSSTTVIYVGRPTKWGNPFIIGKHGTREQVIELYRKWLTTNKFLMADLIELRGHDLECWCAPLPCHADVLLELANKEME